MTETTITVQGSFSSWYPAERATVQVDVSLEGPDREQVVRATTLSADAVRASITDLHSPDQGPITWWSSDRVTVWVEKPWNQEGKQLPPVFHASISFRAKFKDFDALARWIESTATIEGVQLGHIEWALTEARKTSVTAEVRSRAVRDALDKAKVFAQSIGLSTVRAVAIADPGMLGDSTSASGGAGMYKSEMRLASADMSSVVLKPEDIEVSATVDARFVAS